uniref:Uncharacterized protein n=1 Tax=Arundo donax TaxID=35708 RepID=A0A0A9G948_ARUDO
MGKACLNGQLQDVDQYYTVRTGKHGISPLFSGGGLESIHVEG